MNVDHENTARRLRGELPILQSIWCQLGLHRWTIWSEPYQKTDDRQIQRQKRSCVHCNRTQERHL